MPLARLHSTHKNNYFTTTKQTKLKLDQHLEFLSILANTMHIGQILKKHWHLIESDPTLKILWPNIPMVAYKSNKNIKEMLVSCKLIKTGNKSSE
jgi:hypothetical protein